jgi:hypothetical protein
LNFAAPFAAELFLRCSALSVGDLPRESVDEAQLVVDYFQIAAMSLGCPAEEVVQHGHEHLPLGLPAEFFSCALAPYRWIIRRICSVEELQPFLIEVNRQRPNFTVPILANDEELVLRVWPAIVPDG